MYKLSTFYEKTGTTTAMLRGNFPTPVASGPFTSELGGTPKTKGNTPATLGEKMIVPAEGLSIGTIGGGSLERNAIEY